MQVNELPKIQYTKLSKYHTSTHLLVHRRMIWHKRSLPGLFWEEFKLESNWWIGLKKVGQLGQSGLSGVSCLLIASNVDESHQ